MILSKDHDIMEKAHTLRFVLDGLKLRKLHALSMNIATVGALGMC